MARTRIVDAIRLVREQPDHPHIRRWFGDAPRKTIRITLELTAARLHDMTGVQIRCNDPPGCPGGRFAYARETRHGPRRLPALLPRAHGWHRQPLGHPDP